MISAVVLTHNDENTIQNTLNSLSWCDEVIVVDDNSTDRTSAISKQSNAKLFTRALTNDFASQRNFGLEKAKGDWILFVDSDEVVSSGLADEIQHCDFSCDGYFIKRTDFMWGRELKHGETANIRLLRLAKKAGGIWKESVHEVWDIKGKTGELNSPLLHYPHPSVSSFLDQINTYSTIRAQYLFDAKVPAHGWHIVAYPLAKFLKNYIVLRGFLDGMPGLIVAVMMSIHSFLVRGKLYLRYNKKEVPTDSTV